MWRRYSPVTIIFIVLCIGVGVVVGLVSPHTPPTAASQADREKQASDDYAEISGLPPGPDRDRRLKQWEAKYPDLADGIRRNAGGPAGQ